MNNLICHGVLNWIDAGYNLIYSNINKTMNLPAKIIISEQNIPVELIKEIFSLLNFKDLLNCAAVNSKEWKILANDPLLLKKVIYKNHTFSPEDWALHFKDPSFSLNDRNKAWELLPDNIGKIFKSSSILSTKKKLGETHKIVWIPAGMTINHYEELFKKNSQEFSKGYAYKEPKIIERFGDEETKKSEWILIPKKFNSEASKKDFSKPIDVAKFVAGKDEVARTNLTLIEAIICISTTFFKSKERILANCAIRCHERINNLITVVNFSSSSLIITVDPSANQEQ